MSNLTVTRWLSIPDAARYCAVGTESIRRLLASGRLTAFRPTPGRIVLDQNELDRYILATGTPATV